MTHSHSQNIIDFKDVSFSYGQKNVLTEINLSIHKGDYLAVIGPNGAGKTTLMKLLFRVHNPESGNILVFNKPIAQFSQWWRIGYVPQRRENADANFPVTVFETVLMGRYAKRGLFHMTTTLDYAKAETALSRVGLSHLKNQMISDLSGGQTQRVYIARALASEPELLVLDEPTAGVDQTAQDGLYDLLRKLNQDEGVTIVLVSHDIEAIAKETSQLAYIDRTLSYHKSALSFIEHDLAKVISHGHDH